MKLNFAYYLYIKTTSILYRFIKYLSVRNQKYTSLLDDLANHNKDVIMNSDLITHFRYEVVKYIPHKYLDILIYTDNVVTDVVFLLRLYKTIIEIPEFIELGSVKIVIICTHGEEVFTLAKSFPITPNTTPHDFMLHFFKGIIKLSAKSYNIDSFDVLFVKTISGDPIQRLPEKSVPVLGGNKNQTRNYSTGSRTVKLDNNLKDFVADGYGDKNRDPRRFILPLQPKDKQMTKIAVFDIETFVHEGKLYPYAIAIQYNKYNKLRKVIYYYEDLYDSVEKNSSAMLEKMVDHMVANCKSYTIFAHNLGKFDGILMMSSIFKVLGPHSLMVGKDNRIISIKFKGIKLLDSLKIFPVSLAKLAKQFEVETQKGSFEYSKVNVNNVCDEDIKSEVLKYIEGDISSLYECMMKASDHIFNNYKINVSDVYSASSLAMKHFRTSYLDKEGIPLLPKHMIDIISAGYYGGISQVYKPYGKDLYYYDINSLYPWAMTQPMPFEYLGLSYNAKLEDIFGFAYASVYVPEGLDYKPLPVRMDDGSLATPSGHILDVYFTEELKYAESLGCTITIHKAYIFSQKYIFNGYVEDIYEEKSKAEGSDRVFVKLLLNGLYGFFARNDEKLIALFLPLDEAIKQAQIYPSYNIILMDDNETALLIRDIQPSKEHCEATNNNYYEFLDTNNSNRTKSNRAIAAAITGYSRVRIHEFKVLCGDVYYSDTDSIVSGNKLSEKYVNNDLGFMKEEFSTNRISEAVFISPKLYGLKFKDGTELIKAKGVPANVLDFDALMRLRNGEVIKYERTQLFKSLNLFSIFEKDLSCEVKLTIPTGKVPIYDEGNIIIGFKDIHRNVITAIKLGAFRSKLSTKVARLIDKYKTMLTPARTEG